MHSLQSISSSMEHCRALQALTTEHFKHHTAFQALIPPSFQNYPVPEDLLTERFLSSFSCLVVRDFTYRLFWGFRVQGLYIYICMLGDMGLSPVPLLQPTPPI